MRNAENFRGIYRLLEKLREAGYDPNISIAKKLGSSSRYGFHYGDHHLWKPLLRVQYYLDSIEADLELLPARAKNNWEKITDNLKSKGFIEKRLF